MLLISGAVASQAQIRLPGIIRDSMILQRDQPVRLWGWASPAEKVALVFKGKTYTTSTGADGRWHILLAPVKAGGPYTLKFIGKTTVQLKNVLFGDVWLCSGQSNMVHQMGLHDVRYAQDIAEANYSQIRQFLVPTRTNLAKPDTDLAGRWQIAVGDRVKSFSAVAFFFARKLYQQTKVPIGIINASVGGTPIEAWISEQGFKTFPDVLETIKNNRNAAVNGTGRVGTAVKAPDTPVDKGLTAQVKWFDPGYRPRGWRTINIPGYWEDQGIKDLNGVVWYRRVLDVPASMAGKAAKVFLGRIVDADELYINGIKVGNTTYQYPQRRYSVPAGLLKQGKNLFVIRVTNNFGKGGFVPDKPYCLFAGKDTVDLKGYWQYKVGQVNRPMPVGEWGITQHIEPQNAPTALYNAMVAPITDYAIKGIAWYQGESNTGQPKRYERLLPALIGDWRSHFHRPELPFLYVQLPGFMDYNYLPSESQWAKLRESQLKTLRISNTAMVVTIDAGEWNDVHPDRKQVVGNRLALAAMAKVYGKAIEYSGPIFRSAAIMNDRIMVSFDHVGSGLVSNDGEDLAEFAIAGADKRFVWAEAKIEGDHIIVWSDEIKKPLYVRYAWADDPVQPNLYNKEGLPASPFRTDH